MAVAYAYGAPPDIASIRKGGGTSATPEESARVRDELSTLSPEKFGMAINLAVQRATKVQQQKIFHSRRQIAGEGGGGGEE